MSRLPTTNMSAFQNMSTDQTTPELDALPGKRKLAEMQAGSSSDGKQRTTDNGNNNTTDHLWNRPRPILQGIRRQRRPSSLQPIRAVVPPPAGGPLTPLTPQTPNSFGSTHLDRETTTTATATAAATDSNSASVSAQLSPSMPMSLTEGEEQRWQDVDRNVRRMDEMFDASFHPWLRSETNVWISAGYLQRLAREFPAERTAQAVAWLADGWRVESSAVLVRVITHNWCQEDATPTTSTSNPISNSTPNSTLTAGSVHGSCCRRCCCCCSTMFRSADDQLRSGAIPLTSTRAPSSRLGSNLRLAHTRSAPSPLAVSMTSAAPTLLTQPDYTSSPQLRNTAKIVRAISRQYPPVQVAQLITAAFGDICSAKLQALVELITVGWDAGRFVTLVAGLSSPIDVHVRISLLERAQRICRQANEAEHARLSTITTTTSLLPNCLIASVPSGRVALQRRRSPRYGTGHHRRQHQEEAIATEKELLEESNDMSRNGDNQDIGKAVTEELEKTTKKEEDKVDNDTERTDIKRQRLDSSASPLVENRSDDCSPIC